MFIKTKAWGQVPICRSKPPPSFNYILINHVNRIIK